MASPAHVRNDPHPEALGNGDPFEVVNRGRTPSLQGNFLIPLSAPQQYFTDLQAYTQQHFFSSETCFTENMPGPQVAYEDNAYFYDAWDRKIAYKGTLFLLMNKDKKYATIDSVTAREQFDELGPQAVLYAASLIKHYYDNYCSCLTVSLTGSGSGSVTSDPTGIQCSPDCTSEFNPQTQVTLTAAASQGSTFTGWSGDCSGSSATFTVTMDGDKTCNANFDLSSPTYTYLKFRNYATSNAPLNIVVYSNSSRGNCTSTPVFGCQIPPGGDDCTFAPSSGAYCYKVTCGDGRSEDICYIGVIEYSWLYCPIILDFFFGPDFGYFRLQGGMFYYFYANPC